MVTPSPKPTIPWAFPAAVFAVNTLALLLAEVLLTQNVNADTGYRDLWQYVLLVVVSIGFLASFIRRRDVRLTWEVVGAVSVVVGVWSVPAFFLPVWAAITVSGIVTLAGIAWKPFLNIFTFVGIVGMAFALASWIPIEVLLVGLAMLVAYDMVAGSHGHAVQALLDRVGPKAFLPRLDVGTAVGAFELAMPCAVALAIVPINLFAGIFVAIGGAVGACIAAVRTPRELRVEYVAIGTLVPAVIVLLFRVFL